MIIERERRWIKIDAFFCCNTCTLIPFDLEKYTFVSSSTLWKDYRCYLMNLKEDDNLLGT